jgi:hypothetical protein
VRRTTGHRTLGAFGHYYCRAFGMSWAVLIGVGGAGCVQPLNEPRSIEEAVRQPHLSPQDIDQLREMLNTRLLQKQTDTGRCLSPRRGSLLWPPCRG